MEAKKPLKRDLFGVDREELRQWFEMTEQEKFITPISQLPRVSPNPEWLQKADPEVQLYYTNTGWKKTKTGKQRIRKVRKPRVTTREQRRIMKQEKDSGTRFRTKFPNQKEIDEDIKRKNADRLKRKREWLEQKMEKTSEEYTSNIESQKQREQAYQDRMLGYLRINYPYTMQRLYEGVQPIQKAYDPKTHKKVNTIRTTESLY